MSVTVCRVALTSNRRTTSPWVEIAHKNETRTVSARLLEFDGASQAHRGCSRAHISCRPSSGHFCCSHLRLPNNSIQIQLHTIEAVTCACFCVHQGSACAETCAQHTSMSQCTFIIIFQL